MARPLYIRLYKRGPLANLYVVHFGDRDDNELDAFFRTEKDVLCSVDERERCLGGGKSCRKTCRRQEYLERLYDLLDLSTEEDGFRPEFFRPFDNYRFPTCALQAGHYRLFGMRFDTDLFVAAGGGIKLVRAIQDDPALAAAFEDLKDAARRLRKRMKMRGLDHPPRDDRGLLYLPDALINEPFLP